MLPTDGDPSICIAILDGRVDRGHDAIVGANLVCLDESRDAADGQTGSHGTHVASLLFGQPGTSVRGMVPRCRGLAIPIFQERRKGVVAPCMQSDLARAIIRAAQFGAQVINVSAGELQEGRPDRDLTEAIDFAMRRGAVIVAAAGNDGVDRLRVPGDLPWVVAVGALDKHDRVAAFSNRDGRGTPRLIFAPGANILGARLGGGVAKRSGTSVAAAIVSGAIAQVMTAALRLGRSVSSIRAASTILETARHIPSAFEKCLDINAAIKAITGEVAVPTNENALPNHESASTDASTPQSTGEVVPLDCACETKEAKEAACACEAKPQLVFVIGALEIDYESPARKQAVESAFAADSARAKTAPTFHEWLRDHVEWATQLVWVLKQDDTPVYALRPLGAAAEKTIRWLIDHAAEKANKLLSSEPVLVAVPGYAVTQTVSLYLNAASTQVLVPELSGMSDWTKAALLKQAKDLLGAKWKAEDDQPVNEMATALIDAIRNKGKSSEERARNFITVNMAHVLEIFAKWANLHLVLDSVRATPAPSQPNGRDYWDVMIRAFSPHDTKAADHVSTFTVDVVDVNPILVAKRPDRRVRPLAI